MLSRECGACGAEPGEPCRPWCIGEAAEPDRFEEARQATVGLLRGMVIGLPAAVALWALLLVAVVALARWAA